MSNPDPRVSSPLAQVYDNLWQEARAAFVRGHYETDPFLAAPESDRRTGLTVIARPDWPVRTELSALVTRLAQAAPGQYVYRPEEMHITVLSLFTATEHHAPFLARTPDYRAAVDEALAGVPRFAVRFAGITASSSSVMIQGFPEDDTLECVRGRLRTSLGDRGLGAGLDQRYRIITAHCTIMRFRTPPRDGEALIRVIEASRNCDLGVAQVLSLQLVENDWYMSRDRVKVLCDYTLAPIVDERVE